MNKSAAGSRHFSHSHTGNSASGIGGGGAGTTLARFSLSAYYRESKVCIFSSYCKSKSQMHSETHHGNRDTECCLLFSFSSLLQEACFQPILLQYSRPRRIMCQMLRVRLILEKNASLEDPFFFSFLVSQAAKQFNSNQFLPNVKCTNQASSSSTKVKNVAPVEREAFHECDSMEANSVCVIKRFVKCYSKCFIDHKGINNHTFQ